MISQSGKNINKNREFNLTEREQTVFKSILEHYIREAEPVGSRKIAREFNLSSATIRNIMADLEDLGLLKQPHVSAGRVPTDEGYRYFVDNMVPSASDDRVHPAFKQRIQNELDSLPEIEKILNQVSSLLSNLSSYAGLVTAPQIINMSFQRIQFIRLSNYRILTILVAKSGFFQNKIVLTEQDFSQEALDRMANMLNNRFENKTLQDIRTELVVILEEERKEYDQLMESAARIGELALAQDLERDKVYIEGAINIVQLPEFKDLGKIQAMYHTFSERAAMVRLIDRCLDDEGVTIAIGAETDIPEISDMSIVAAKYSIDDNLSGGLGVIGPRRMPYEDVISLVAYTASAMSLLLKKLNDPGVVLDFLNKKEGT